MTGSDTDAGTDGPAISIDASVRVDSALLDTKPTPTDTDSPIDSRMRPDVVVDPPFTCDSPLPSSFVCTTPTAIDRGGPPSTVCAEADLQALATDCIGPDFKVGADCGSWKTAHPACATCVGAFALDASVIPGLVYPDRDKCWYQLLDASCSTSLKCMFACDQAVCVDCDTTVGSGADGIESEFVECVDRERKKGGTVSPRGACYDIATGAALECLTRNAALIEPCQVDELFSPSGPGGRPDLTKMRDEVVQFYRGACRDNGIWTRSGSP